MNKKRKAHCLAVMGTGSDVGKSVIATALCRLFANRGIRVAPFKAQNMSNNSGVTVEGLEMGRAQIVQAEAAGIPPHVDMNPVLLKPTSDVGSQVVLQGKALDNYSAAKYFADKKEDLFSLTCAALDRLRQAYDLVIMEGAGSCAEVNLMANDIVNLRMAEYAAAPVILTGDIHRGGIFAQLVGTLACLPAKNRKQISGFIINRFRGDIELFRDGVVWIEDRTQKPVFGVLPWYTHISIESEDSVIIENPKSIEVKSSDLPAIAIIRIPHISNFTDFDPLSNLEGLTLHFIEKTQDLKQFKAVIIPGSKNTRFDLDWLKSTGWTKIVKQYADSGGSVLGICGGYQILGEVVHDPGGIEGAPGSTIGLCLLPVETELKAPKTTTLTKFVWQETAGSGYEIHMGLTKTKNATQPFVITERNGKPCRDGDGCISRNAKILGTYLHGLFEPPAITRLWLCTLGYRGYFGPCRSLILIDS